MTTDLEKKQHAHEHGPNCTHDKVSDHEEHTSSSESEGDDDDKILNRNEKKARKLMSKMGLKPVADIERVTIKRARMIFAIANPTVYKSGESYVVFGEAKVEDQGFQAQAMAAQRLAMAAQQEAASEKEKMPEEAEDEEEVDAEGCDEKDIRIVMEQTGVPRSKAVVALKANNNDIVNTIMELTM